MSSPPEPARDADADAEELRRLRRELDDLRRAHTLLEDAMDERAEELERANAFLDAIVDHIPDMLFVKDAEELRFLLHNRAGEELLGIPRAELLGRNDHDFFPAQEADFFTAKDRDVLSGGKPIDIPEEPIHTREHGERWLHTKKVPILDDDGTPRYLLGISRDITEKRRTEAELARHVAALAQSNADLEDFAYVASHDLQEPLRKIRSFGELLAERARDLLDDEARDFLDRMTASAERMRVLVQSLLSLSRVTTSDGSFVEVDLDDAVDEVVSDLDVLVRETGGTVEIERPLPRVVAEPTMLRQLLQNLIGNALKFRRAERPSEVRVGARAEGEGVDAVVWIRVEDDGIGFDPARATDILRPFRRLHGRGEYEGVGMGLAICQRIVERHGGRLEANSEPGRGSAFRVALPVRGPATRPAEDA